MKTLITTSILAMLLAMSAIAQDGQRTDEEAMAAYMELAQPGPEHQLLENMVGGWHLSGKLWMMPGSEPMVFENAGSSKMVLGGRFLQSESSGEMAGMTIEHLQFIGFDRRHKKYTTVGFDNTGTYWVSASGKYDEATKTLTMYGEDIDPIAGITQKYNFIWHFESDDKVTFSAVFLNPELTGGADEFKMVEIVYTRK